MIENWADWRQKDQRNEGKKGKENLMGVVFVKPTEALRGK